MNQNQNETDTNANNSLNLDEQYSVVLSRRDLELLFKYLARADLKGAEVPELNKVVSIFDPSRLKKV